MVIHQLKSKQKNPIRPQLADSILYLLQNIHGRNVLFFTVKARLLNSNTLVFKSASWVSYSEVLKSIKKKMKFFVERTPLKHFISGLIYL